MPLPTAARAAKLVKLAKEALTTLVTGPTAGELLPRSKLFSVYESQGPIEKMQLRVLKNLEKAGAITSMRVEGARRGQAVLWSVHNAVLVSELLTDETKISEALWPTQNAVGAEAALYTTEAVESPEDTGAGTSDILQEAMLAVLKSVKGIGDGIAALNARLDAIEKKVSTPGVPSTYTPSHQALAEITANISRLQAGQNHLVTAVNAIPESAFSKEPAKVVAALLGALSLPRLGEAEAKALHEGDELLYYHGPLPEPVRVISVRAAVGQPITVNVMRPGGTPVAVTPKSLSHRRAA